MKRILAIFFCLCLFCLGGGARSANAEASPQRDFRYTLFNDAVIITGYTGQGGIVDIPSSFIHNGREYPVTGIGSGAFRNNTALTSVIIPDSVKDIDKNAFSFCNSLTSVTIPDSVTSIGGYAFQDCISLTAITIPDGVTSIGERAFSGCTSLTDISIPGSLVSIGFGMFYGCSGLMSVTIPEGVTGIGAYAFYSCTGLMSVTIPQGVTGIGAYSFYGCSSLMNITIPQGVTGIGEAAFAGCSGLTDISLPASLAGIGMKAFYGCASLTAVTIPEGVTSIGEGMFYNCSGLTAVSIPSSVKNIGEKAFYGCASLTSVTIPQGVTGIGKNAFESSGLTAVTVSRSVVSIGKQLFLNCGALNKVYYEGTQAEWGTLIKGIDLGLSSAVKVVGQTSCTVTFKVENGAWNDGETADKTVRIACWEGESGLQKLEEKDIPEVGAMPNNNYSEGGWKSPAPAAGMDISSNVSFTYAYVYNSWQQDNYALKRVGREVTITLYSGSEADVSIPAKFEKDGIEYSVVAIAENAFTNCASLTSVTIPEGVRTIGSNAFDGCKNLKSVTVPGTLTEIGSRVFNGCTSLTRLYFDGAREDWENGSKVVKDKNWKKGVTVGFTIICRGSCVVTFKVKNGAWNDGTAEDKVLTLTGWEDENKWKKMKSADIPKAGSNPAEDYTKGGWKSPAPAAGTDINEAAVTYTYVYVAIDYTPALTLNKAIGALPAPENMKLSDQAAIVKARADYDALTEEQKTKVSEENLNKLEEAEQQLIILKAAAAREASDAAAAKPVTDAIKALPAPENVELADRSAIVRARSRYNDLTAEQKAKVDAQALKKLEAVVKALNDLLEAEAKEEADTAAAQAVTDVIDALSASEDTDMTDQAAVDQARAQYNALTEDQKAKIERETLKKLEAAEQVLDNLRAAAEKEASDAAAAQHMTDMINELPDPENVKLSDQSVISRAQSKYDTLTEDQKAKVDEDALRKLEDDKKALESLQLAAAKESTDNAAAQIVTDAIKALPAPKRVKLKDQETVEQARAKYNALTEDQKARIDEETLEKLEAAEQTLADLQAAVAKAAADAAAVQAVTEAISLLPAPENAELTDQAAVDQARTKYDALTEEQKAKVNEETLKKLVAAEQTLNELQEEAAREAVAAAAAQAVADAINALPAQEDIKLADQADVDKARVSYNVLSESQKARISRETLKKLEAAEQALDNLQNAAAKDAADSAAAQHVTNVINALPEPENVMLTDEAAIDRARTNYNALTDDQKAKIKEDTLKRLEDAEQALKAITSLTEEQIAKINAHTVKRMEESIPAQFSQRLGAIVE